MDKIEIIKGDGNKEIMEIVLIYEYKEDNYIIYKDDLNNYYIAKYNDNNLDTDLNDSEIKYGESVLRGVISEITSK